MAIAAAPDEFPRCQIALLRHHASQQRIGCDIEWHPEKDVSAALIELARKSTGRHVELKQDVTRRKCHALEFADVPCAHQHAARIRIGAQLPHYRTDLIDL